MVKWLQTLAANCMVNSQHKVLWCHLLLLMISLLQTLDEDTKPVVGMKEPMTFIIC